MESVITEVRELLREGVDEKTLRNGQNYFKEKIRFYGVRIPLVNKISKETFERVKGIPREEVYALCEELWQSGYLEESFVACNWSYYIRESYQPEDIDRFERWIDTYVNNWASCDTLCNHTVGTFMEMYPGFAGRLRAWTASGNRWMKRAAAVTLIIPARKGLFLEEIFQIADILLTDQDDCKHSINFALLIISDLLSLIILILTFTIAFYDRNASGAYVEQSLFPFIISRNTFTR